MIDTDRWPFVAARWFTPVSADTPRRVRVLVVHDMEYSETDRAAEDVAHYFATTETKASAHICVDNDSIVQCVRDRDVAWAAPGCNSDGIHVELAGYGAQTVEQWDDGYSRALLNNAAHAVAQYCVKYSLPVRRLTNAELQSGAKGIVGHVQVSEVYRRSDHTDPGPNFPWVAFLAQVQAYADARLLRAA
jgi:N-acetyl-anhydromuramyl-L-alanine amidase AmpD